MTELFPIWFIQGIFWPSLLFDYLLLASIIFLPLYLAGLLLEASLPLSWRPASRRSWLPLLGLACLILPATPAGNYCASVLKYYLGLGQDEDLIVQFGTYLLPLACLGLWLGGCAWRFGQGLKEGLELRRLLAAARPVEDPVFREALRASKPSIKMRLCESAGLASAASWRLGRAYILLPAGFVQNLPDQARRAVYLHELNHLKRRDSLRLLALLLLKGLFWFNPLVLHALGRYKNHLEMACDRAVLESSQVDRQAYARLLLSAASGGNGLAPGFAGQPEDTARRLCRIFGDRAFLPRPRHRLKALACLGLLLLALVSYPQAPLPRQPWGEISEVTLPDGTTLTMDVSFDWHGVLGSYVRANTLDSRRP